MSWADTSDWRRFRKYSWGFPKPSDPYVCTSWPSVWQLQNWLWSFGSRLGRFLSDVDCLHFCVEWLPQCSVFGLMKLLVFKQFRRNVGIVHEWQAQPHCPSVPLWSRHHLTSEDLAYNVSLYLSFVLQTINTWYLQQEDIVLEFRLLLPTYLMCQPHWFSMCQKEFHLILPQCDVLNFDQTPPWSRWV